jgi:hypothetical protein
MDEEGLEMGLGGLLLGLKWTCTKNKSCKGEADLYGWNYMRKAPSKGDLVCTCKSIRCDPTTS